MPAPTPIIAAPTPTKPRPRPRPCSRPSPDDPFFLELKGQVLLEGGQPAAAIAPLRRAVSRAPDQPMIAVMLGHALIATDDQTKFPEAKQVLKNAVNRDNDNPFAWYQLGIVYDREGDRARASLATAERQNLDGETKLALAAARSAMMGLESGHARLSSRAGHRHGVRDRAQEEKEEQAR